MFVKTRVDGYIMVNLGYWNSLQPINKVFTGHQMNLRSQMQEFELWLLLPFKTLLLGRESRAQMNEVHALLKEASKG